MATKTPNLGLTKPDPSDYYDVDVFNRNADLIDKMPADIKNDVLAGKNIVTGTVTWAAGSYSINIALPYPKPALLLLKYSTNTLMFAHYGDEFAMDLKGSDYWNGGTWSDTNVSFRSNAPSSSMSYTYFLIYDSLKGVS